MTAATWTSNATPVPQGRPSDSPTCTYGWSGPVGRPRYGGARSPRAGALVRLQAGSQPQHAVHGGPPILDMSVDRQLGVHHVLVCDDDVGRGGRTSGHDAFAAPDQAPATGPLSRGANALRAHELDLGEALDQRAREIPPAPRGSGGIDDRRHARLRQPLRGVDEHAMGDV